MFRFLIAEAPYLIDDKSLDRCAGADAKETLKIKIDSVRKSLGIEDMNDVELLVDILYKFQEKHEKDLEEEKKRMEEEEHEELEKEGQVPEANPNSLNDLKKTSNEPTLNGGADGQASREEEEVDENKLNLDPELLTPALKEFHTAREERDLRRDLLQQKNKKQSKESKSTDKARDNEKEKKKAKLYWAQMTKILSDQKLSVW